MKNMTAVGMMAASVVAIFIVPACESTRDCRNDTLYVDLRLTPAGAQADVFRVTVAPDGLSSKSAQFDHPVGEEKGSLELTFAEGEYPTGLTGTVTVLALLQGVVLESRTVATTFGAGCHSLRMDFSDTARPDGGDMGGGDADIVVPDAMGKPDAYPVPDAAPTCTRSGPETCYDGIDNDCNRLSDCEDPACQPNSQCVPVNAASSVDVGILLTDPAQTCPNGFIEKSESPIGKDVQVGKCVGCACDGVATQCTANLKYYLQSRTNCLNDASGTGTTFEYLVRESDQSASCMVPQYEYVYGAKLDAWRLSYTAAACTAKGTPRAEPAKFGSQGRFCVAKDRGTGCGPAGVCIRKENKQTSACVAIASAGNTCPTGLQAVEWYRKMEDNTRCGACECSRPDGGSCNPLTVYIQNDYSCGDVADLSVTSNTIQCIKGVQGLYSPGARVGGNPAPGSCSPSAPTLGQARGTDPLTLCCSQ